MVETLDDVLKRAKSLSLADQLRLIEALANELRSEVLSERQRAWYEFLNKTAGSLADDPIERAPQGEFEVRDSRYAD